jgi:hypothetical protein
MKQLNRGDADVGLRRGYTGLDLQLRIRDS